MNNFVARTPGVKQINAVMQLVDHMTKSPTSYIDEAPILRAILYLSALAPADEVIHATAYFPRYAYDAYIVKDIIQVYSRPTTDAVACNTMVPDLETMFQYYNGEYAKSGWDGQSLMYDVTAIPTQMSESGSVELIAKVLIYTDNIWTFGRISNKSPIRCQGANCQYNDFLYLQHLASLVHVPTRTGKSGGTMKVLFILPTMMSKNSLFQIPTVDRRKTTIPNLNPIFANSNNTPAALDITPTVLDWLDKPSAWPRLIRALKSVLKDILKQNVGQPGQRMLWLAAELSGYVPLNKSLH